MIDRFREEMPAHLHEGLPDDVVRKTMAFQWWEFGELLLQFGRDIVAAFGPRSSR